MEKVYIRLPALCPPAWQALITGLRPCTAHCTAHWKQCQDQHILNILIIGTRRQCSKYNWSRLKVRAQCTLQNTIKYWYKIPAAAQNTNNPSKVGPEEAAETIKHLGNSLSHQPILHQARDMFSSSNPADDSRYGGSQVLRVTPWSVRIGGFTRIRRHLSGL